MQTLSMDLKDLKPYFPRDNFAQNQSWEISASALIGQLQWALSNQGKRSSCSMLRPDTREGVLYFQNRELMTRLMTLNIGTQKYLPAAAVALMKEKQVGELLVGGVTWGRFTERTLKFTQWAGKLDSISLSLI